MTKSILSRFGLVEHNIHLGMLDFSIIIVFGPRTKLVDYINWKFDSNYMTDVSGGRGYYFHRPGYCPILWFPRVPRSSRDIGTIAHESLHAISVVMKWTDTRFTDDTEEIWAHALGFLVTEILNVLRKP